MPVVLNRVLLIGEVGRDPEMRYTSSGRPVASFGLAVGRSWSGQDGRRHEETDWFNVVAWGSLAERSHQQLRSGQLIFVEGQLKNRQWQDAEGRTQSATEVVASELVTLGARSVNHNSTAARAATENGA